MATYANRGSSLPVGSSSPSRPSPLARPQWPWAASHRPSSAASSSSGFGHNPFSPSGPNDSLASAGAFSGSPKSGVRRQAHHSSLSTSQLRDTTFREWTFTALEWTVTDLQKLQCTLSEAPSSDVNLEDFGLLKDTPIIGDGKYMVEVSRKPRDDEGDASNPASDRLSLSMTSLVLDFAHAEFEMPSSMMAAIKCLDGHTGERGSKVEWVWEVWDQEFVFRQGSEVWYCVLPDLELLLRNPGISIADAFVLCLQIHSPIGPYFPTHPTTLYVPRELLAGLESSLDNANTGDVRFFCLERRPTAPDSFDSSASLSSSQMTALPSHMAYRKRVLWAHRDILIQRSDYFATMLDSSFSEALSYSSGERRLFSVIVEQTDFVTLYWLLKWIYANWLSFDSFQDPRTANDTVLDNWHLCWHTASSGSEWEWRIMTENGFEEETPFTSREDAEISSVDSSTSRFSDQKLSSGSTKDKQSRSTANNTAGALYRNVSHPGRQSTIRISPVTGSRPKQGAPLIFQPSNENMSGASAKNGGAVSSGPTSPVSTRGTHPSLSASPRQPRQTHSPVDPDPHAHPASVPAPASALAIYQLAHRYGLVALQSLALDHIINGLSTENSFPLLLASSVWDDLRTLIEEFIVRNWEHVTQSTTFARCCQEVASGEWGPQGGQVLVSLFRKLRSPFP